MKIVGNHLKALDYDQLSIIGSDFAQRFIEHQRIISQIVKSPSPGFGGLTRESEEAAEFEVVDTRPLPARESGYTDIVRTSPDEVILTHYDRMIRSQYDRLIDLTVQFLKEVTASEVAGLRAQTMKVHDGVKHLREDAEEEARILREEIGQLEGRCLALFNTLKNGMIRQSREMAVLKKRFILLGVSAGIAAVVGGMALILTLVK